MSIIRNAMISAWMLALVPLGPVAAQNDVSPPDVFAATMMLRQDLELLRQELNAPLEERDLVKVSNAAPREVYFQAITLRLKSERLCSQQLENTVGLPTSVSITPDRELRPSDVLEVVLQAQGQIRCATAFFGLAATREAPARDSTKTPTDVFQSIVQANRQINLLLKEQFSPNEVIAAVRLANTYTTAVLDDLAPVWRASSTPASPFVEGKRPVDVYQALYGCNQIIERIAQQSGLEILRFEPELRPDIVPSDVFNLATLIVSQLRYFSTFTSVEVSHRFRSEPDRTPSHVHQEAETLRSNLQVLAKLVNAFPEWAVSVQ